MPSANTKRIEESATTALKAALLRCPILDSYIDSNDKTPSWDGTVFVYKSEKTKKENLAGRVPIQIKGTEKVIVSDTATFSCSVADLNNYYKDGGCVFFLISVDLSSGNSRIFYKTLLVVDLNKIIKGAGKQKTSTIHLNLFPTEANEISSIFMEFTDNVHKQMGFIGKDIPTFESLEANGAIQVAEEVADSRDSVINILDSVYDSRAMQPENARDKNVELQVDPDKLAMPEFKALWNRISPKSVYVVDFDTDELVKKAIASLNQSLHVPKIFFKVETGAMDEIKSKDSLLDGSAFSKSKSSTYDSSKQIRANSSVKYDLIGKLVGETGLTRKAVVAILTGIEKSVFEQFKFNPEEFIIKAAALINDEKATAIIQHITYNVLDEHYDTDIFTEPTIKGKLGTNAMKAQRHLYDHIVYDSTNERDFATDLDTNADVAVYVKLPDSFYIATPVGHYNPDWAIAFYEGTVKHIYFVAETKGSMSSMQLRLIEESKIHCAREHFKAISNGNVVYDVVDSYQTLLEKVMR